MPRHRKERVPRHWARRPAGRPARRARLSAATSDGAPEGADATLLLPPALRNGQPGLVAGAVRGLLVAPWFAAAMGFVVAVGIFVSAPHAELKFPSAVGVVPCQVAGCGTQAGQGAGNLTTTKGQRLAHPKKAAGAARSGTGRRSAASGLTFAYVVIWNRHGKFAVQITVRGKKALSGWQLSFAMAGDQITYVVGAAWRPTGTDGGTASVLDGQLGQWGNDGDRGGPDISGRSISFTVLGKGAPAAPTSCTFDHATCQFS